MIIDSHVHVGNGSVWGDFPVEYLLSIISESVDIAICSNLEGIDSNEFKNEYDSNLSMLEIATKNSKLKPLLVCQPNLTENSDVIRKLLLEHPEVIGLKFHPESMKLPADSSKYDAYLRLAQEFKLPCLYHSGHIKSRFSSPELIYKKAQEFPNVPIVLGHLSTGPRESHLRAVNIVLESIEKQNSLLFVDTSWLDFAYEKLDETYQETIALIRALKNSPRGDYTHRILWASDCPVGAFNHEKQSYEHNLNLFKTRVMEEFNDKQLLENLLYKNALKLYDL